MGFLSKVNPFKASKKLFKKHAKRIKRLGSSVWKGIKKHILKPVGKLYAKTFGKLGPLGMIAASFILPGIGTMLGGMLTAGVGMGGVIGTVSTAIQNAVTWTQGVWGTVTSTLEKGLTLAGKTVTEGATNLWGKSAEWTATNMPKTYEALSKGGDWAMAQARKIAGTPNPSMNITADSGSLLADPAAGGFDTLTGPQSGFNFNTPTPGSILGTGPDVSTAAMQSGNVGSMLTAPTASSVTAGGFNLPEVSQGSIMETTIDPSGAVSVTNPAAKKSLLDGAGDKLGKAAGQALTALGKQPLPDADPFGMGKGSGFDVFGTDRFGAAGQGAFGGQFLTEQQRAFFSNYNSILGQQG